MPPVSRFMIRAALIWLALGCSIGGLMLWNKGVPFAPWLWYLRQSHIEMLLTGWIVQCTYGVAFWVLPRLNTTGYRGHTGPIWICSALLNGGVILRLVDGLLESIGQSIPAPFLSGMAILLQLLGVLLFVLSIGGRIHRNSVYPQRIAAK